jgi:hypothetical protein
MSVTAGGSDPGTAGGAPRAHAVARPREAAPCRAPSRARRMDHRPLPRLRALAAVLAEQRGPAEDRAAVGATTTAGAASEAAGGPAWDAALDAACAQVGPIAVGLLTAVAEVLDGRRPPAHLARLCPSPLVERVRAGLARSAAGFPRGARVRGLRLCPVVGAPGVDGAPELAVEVAAALCGQGRARAAVARFELDRTRTWRVTELAVL